MQNIWAEATSSFQNLSLEFKSFIEEVTSFTTVAQATTIGFTFNIDDYEMFDGNFYAGLTKTSLPAKQRQVRDFINGVGGDFQTAVDATEARLVFYKTIIIR